MNTALLHPIAVHFPVALLIVGFLFATMALFSRSCKKKDKAGECSEKTPCVLKTATWLLCLGAIGALVSVVFGFAFTPKMEGVMGQMRDTHSMLAIITTVVALLTSVLYVWYMYYSKRDCKVHIVIYILYLVTAALVAVTGHLGGAMVY